jgi:hypothetical protein
MVLAVAYHNGHYMRITNAHKEAVIQAHVYGLNARKKSANFSTKSDLLRQAKAHHELHT